MLQSVKIKKNYKIIFFFTPCLNMTDYFALGTRKKILLKKSKDHLKELVISGFLSAQKCKLN